MHSNSIGGERDGGGISIQRERLLHRNTKAIGSHYEGNTKDKGGEVVVNYIDTGRWGGNMGEKKQGWEQNIWFVIR